MKESSTDVLIVGAGPAGLMLATWLSSLNIKTRIVDKRSTKIFTGQADGLQSRTLEVLESFGLGAIHAEANRMMEICFWNPQGPDHRITRTGRIPDTLPGISRFTEVVLHQGRIERHFLDKMRSNGLEVERAVMPDLLEIDETKASDKDSAPVKVRLRHLMEEEATPAQFGPHADGLFRSAVFDDDSADARPVTSTLSGEQELVHCKYVVGCDGARSWVRKQLGFELVGEPANYYWGVVDGVPVTDFPDIRMRCAIHSESSGSVMIIPREHGLVRFYIQLGDLPLGQRVDRSEVTPEKLLAAARRIMAPYALAVPKVEWFTCYEIGQRLCTNVSKLDRVFIAGDAFHTHSPKAGQGMNVSMMDTYNLGWKLAHVIHKVAHPKILSTYEPERVLNARNLIEFDQKFSRLFSGKPDVEVDLLHFKDVFQRGMRFTSGIGVDYQGSVLIAKSPEGIVTGKQEAAPGLAVGQRLKSYQVVCVADARAWHICDKMPSDGRWRILILPGDIVSHQLLRQQLDTLADALDAADGPVRRWTPKGQEVDATVQIFTVLGCARLAVEPDAFPDILRPTYGKYRYRNHWQIFSDDQSHDRGHGHAYEGWGVDPAVGAVAVIRPDGYVALVTDLSGYSDISKFFAEFMLLPARGSVDTEIGHGWPNHSLPDDAS